MAHVLIHLSSTACVHCPGFDEVWRVICKDIEEDETLDIMTKRIESNFLTYKEIEDIPKSLVSRAKWFPSLLLTTRVEWENDNIINPVIFNGHLLGESVTYDPSKDGKLNRENVVSWLKKTIHKEV